MQGSGEKPGIIPRTAKKLFEEMLPKQKNKCVVWVSYLEIYNEKILDLLDPRNTDLPIREDSNRNIFVPGLTRQQVDNLHQFHEVLNKGLAQRTTGPTLLNPTSSRSHAILLFHVEQTIISSSGTRKLQGKLHLIDLAGSENNKRTGNSGIRLTESSNINSSLFTLAKAKEQFLFERLFLLILFSRW